MMIVTVPMVLYGLFRYLYLVNQKGLGERPEEILLTDKHIMGICLLFVACIVVLRDV